jgi:CheY-like chemotaxis protein
MPEGTGKILIADDHRTSLMYISIVVRRLGFQVIPAENGIEAIKLSRMFNPDLIILDIAMPMMGGIEALRIIKNDKQLSSIPVIMNTVSGDATSKRMCGKLGCAGYLTKPMSLSVLNDELQKCSAFPHSQTRRHLRAPFNEKVFVRRNKKEFEFFAFSISEGGIYVRSHDPFPLRSVVTVHLPLKGSLAVTLKGKVIYHRDVYSNLSSIDPGMAIEFTRVSKKSAAALRAYINNSLIGDILEEQDEYIISVDP